LNLPLLQALQVLFSQPHPESTMMSASQALRVLFS
jgi:hypothetical protein